MNSDEITTIKESIPVAVYCINKNSQNDHVVTILPYNENRHYLLETGKGMKYWLLFKRDFFYSFGRLFGFKGIGESINKEWVDHAIKNEINAFIFVYKNRYCYIVPPKEFKDFAEKNNTIRETKLGEITYSIPVKLLRRWK